MLKFNKQGILIPGIHPISWGDFTSIYSFSDRRRHLFTGMLRAFTHFKNAGCKYIYVDGSFVTKKDEPNDYDACWDVTNVDFALLDPMFHRDLNKGTQPHKIAYFGEFFPAATVESRSGLTFLDFFQTDKTTGLRKGIIRISLEEVK